MGEIGVGNDLSIDDQISEIRMIRLKRRMELIGKNSNELRLDLARFHRYFDLILDQLLFYL